MVSPDYPQYVDADRGWVGGELSPEMCSRICDKMDIDNECCEDQEPFKTYFELIEQGLWVQ